MEEYKHVYTNYAIRLRWYGLANYLVALAEQIALWNYAARWFFWVALVLNVLGMMGLGTVINKVEKKII